MYKTCKAVASLLEQASHDSQLLHYQICGVFILLLPPQENVTARKERTELGEPAPYTYECLEYLWRWPTLLHEYCSSN